MPLVVLGGVMVLIGAWMAVVEWRGRFASEPAAPVGEELLPPNIGEQIAKVIEAVGKLRGAALVMVIGVLLMLGAAWIAETAVSSTPATNSATGPTGPLGCGRSDRPDGTDRPAGSFRIKSTGSSRPPRT